MHNLKNKILWLFLAALFCGCSLFVGCASSMAESALVKNEKAKDREIDKEAALKEMFQNFLTAVEQNVPAETMLEMLTDSSEYWLDTLESHARIYTAENLDTCSFYEAYSILLYRLYEREHLWNVTEDKMLTLYLSSTGEIRKFTKLNLGPLKVKNDRGSIGLSKSPEVPIMIFEWDDSAWKLNLAETIPLITKGMEATAQKKNWSGKRLALYWIEQQYHLQYSRLDDSLCEPIGF